MKGGITNNEQQFYLNGANLSGILSVNGGYTVNYSAINTIGVGYNKQVMAQVPNGQVTVSKYLLYNEPFLNYTGEKADKTASSLAGSIHYNNRCIGFTKGYLTSFSLSCSVGEVPKTSASIQVFGDFGKSLSNSGNAPRPYVSVPQIKDISLTCNGSTTNRITSFDYQINCPKKPIYALQNAPASGPTGPSGPTNQISYIPVEVLAEMPIEINASVNMDIDDYQVTTIYDQITSDTDVSFAVNIKGTLLADQIAAVGNNILSTPAGPIGLGKVNNPPTIFSASLSNMKLVSQEFSSTTDQFLSVKLGYKGYLIN